jgi:hypothetical protein
LAPNATLVVISFDPTDPENASRTEAFRAHYGIDASVALVGGWEGQLRDDGESIELQRPGGPDPEDPGTPSRLIEDLFFYDEVAPWPTASGGTGKSLHRATPVSFGMDGALWSSLAASPGSTDFSLAVAGDLTGDGSVNADDIDVLFGAVQAGSSVGFFDLDGTGAVDAADVDFLVRQQLATVPGDANLDGAVDGTDFNIWHNNRWNRCGGWATGDFNGDGMTDGSDFNLWNEHRFAAADVVFDSFDGSWYV